MGASSSGAQLVVERGGAGAEAWPAVVRLPGQSEHNRPARSAAGEAALQRAMRAHPAGRGLAARRPAAPSPALRPAPRLRLTARGRLVLAVLALALAVGLAALVGGLLGGGGNALHLAGESRVVVHQGDTLWSIARSVAGDDDVRAVVARIQQVNDLHGTLLQPGQVLRLP